MPGYLSFQAKHACQKIVFLLITYPYEAALYSIGKPHIALVIKLSVTLTQLIVLIIMLQSVGIVGAGYAAVLSSLLSAVALIYMTNRRIN